MKSACEGMNVHSGQGLVVDTRGHETRYLDRSIAQKPKCIVLLAKMSLQDFTTSSGQKDLHAWSSMHVLVRGSNRILISHTLIYGDSVTRLCCLCCCCILRNLHVRGLNPLSVRLYLKEWFLHKTTLEGVGVGQSKGGVVLALLSLQGRQQRQGRP